MAYIRTNWENSGFLFCPKPKTTSREGIVRYLDGICNQRISLHEGHCVHVVLKFKRSWCWDVKQLVIRIMSRYCLLASKPPSPCTLAPGHSHHNLEGPPPSQMVVWFPSEAHS